MTTGSREPFVPSAGDREFAIELHRVPIRWDLEAGNLSFFGLDSALFWTNPSLLHTFMPLAEEIGVALFRLLIAHSSTFGTREDYHAMVSTLGETFAEGFLAWGRAVSAAGWGCFEMPEYDGGACTATVIVRNPWELNMQRVLPPEKRWGCPFLQGKVIGIFSQAFGIDCWADETCEYSGEEGRVIFRIHASDKTIKDEIERLRQQHMADRERALAEVVRQKTLELVEARRKLEEYSRVLEEKVAERTAELMASNKQLKNEILERNLAEEKLKASRADLMEWQNRYEAAVRVRGQLLYDWNSETDEVTFGDNLKEVLGYTIEEMRGGMSHWTRLIHPDDAEYFKKTIERLVATKDSADFEFRVRKRGSGYISVRVKGSFIKDAHGDVIRMLGFIEDITKEQLVERELQKMQMLKSVGTLAGGIAHDFNNILMGLFGNLSILREELPQAHPGIDILSDAEGAMTRATRLTKQLLTFAKGGEPVREDTSIGELVEKVVRFDLCGSKVLPVFNCESDLWSAEVDKGQIQQVFSNLTMNASQAMPDGGHLYVTLENAVVSGETATSLAPGNYVKITVRDEGIGIARQHLDRIFDPYFTTKQTGSGLGLATTYSIVAKHKGHIGVYSELGRGTIFTVFLPASARPCEPVEEQATAALFKGKRTARVLVMDDEEMILGVTTKMLARNGFVAETALDGAAAIEMYKRSMEVGAPFDVAIVDLTIPGGMGGKEAAEIILSLDPEARIIVSSGYADDHVMAHYSDFGFNGIVAKPYTLKTLLAELSRVLNG